MQTSSQVDRRWIAPIVLHSPRAVMESVNVTKDFKEMDSIAPVRFFTGPRRRFHLIWTIFDRISDVNECMRLPYVCDKNAECVNKEGKITSEFSILNFFRVGSFICQCLSGYAGNGYNCTKSNSEF